MHVLMVAAENDALPNAKVGGVADVVRDCPKALVEKGLDETSIDFLQIDSIFMPVKKVNYLHR